MSKYTIQDTTEENGIKILRDSLDTNLFLINDFATTVGKDKYPDIDGQIRLRDGNGTYLNRYLHYQIKSHAKIDNPSKCLINRKIIDYLVETNVPTLLFIVATESKECYWFFITSQIKKQLNLSVDKRGRNINLTKNKIQNNSLLLNQEWNQFAKGDSYRELVDELDKILDKFKIDIQSCLGILYLFGAIKKQEFPKIFSDLLSIKKHESKTIIEHLENATVISSTVNYYLLENEKLGVESLFLLLDSDLLDFENLDKHLALDNKKLVFEQLNKINHPKVNKYFNALSKEFKNCIPKFKNNDDIFVNLELLEKYVYKTPSQSIQILKKIVNSKKPLKVITRNIKGWGKVEGKSHSDLVKKSIELLERLRYIKTKDTFSLLLKISNSKEKNIRDKANNALEKMARYNLFILQKIGYQPQTFLIDEIEDFGDRKLLAYFDSVSVILRQIIKPSFEGDEMTDYKTLTIHHGGLNASKKLKEIRERSIEILQKLFLFSKTIQQEKETLQILREATQTPHEYYTGELEELILNNTNKIIQFYNEIVGDVDHEIVKEIEEQVCWFTKRYPKKLKNIKKLQSLIAQNDEYNIFKVFVGYSYSFNENLVWMEAEKERKQKIQEFIKQISDGSFNKWQNKILSVVNNYNQLKNYGRYKYFNIFLHELGKQKPKIAEKLIQNKETELEEFLIHLVAGIWESKNKDIAIKLIEKFIKKGKYLSLCALIFSYVKEVDEELLEKAFQKAKQGKDVNALNNVIQSIVDNYSSSKRHPKLFTETIKELTKLENSFWINNVWFQKDSIIEVLPKKDSDIILNNLLLIVNIDYHTEAILKIIVKKHPLKIVKFFEKRINIQSKKKKGGRYNAIPYHFHELTSDLQQHAKIIIPEVLKWFKKKNWLFNWEGGHFLKSIYSINNLDCELVKLLNTGKEKDTKIVLSILSAYQGHIILESKAVQTLIRKYPKHHSQLIVYMSATGGAVSGEYGFVNLLKLKKNSLIKQRKDQRKYMREFVKKYEIFLSDKIKYEKKKANEDLVLMKNKYGS
jgi:hypothetical protein